MRWLYLLTFAAVVFYVSQRIHPWCGAILAWTPQFLVEIEGGALSAYSDIAIAAFVTCAFCELIDGESPLRFGIWLAFLVLTKNEGLPIAMVLAAVAFASPMLRRVRTFAPPLFAATALYIWRSGIPRTDEEDYLRLVPTLPSHLDRLGEAIVDSARHFFVMRSWGFVWIAAWIAMAMLMRQKEWRAPVVMLAIWAIYIGAYLTTTWVLSELIATSADRLLMHTIGPALFAIASAINAFARNRYGPPERQPQPA